MFVRVLGGGGGGGGGCSGGKREYYVRQTLLLAMESHDRLYCYLPTADQVT